MERSKTIPPCMYCGKAVPALAVIKSQQWGQGGPRYCSKVCKGMAARKRLAERVEGMTA